jgi:hypothetical protein
MTWVFESILSAGFYPGIIATGLVISRRAGSERFSERISIAPALGILVWVVPMVVMAGHGLYRPWQFGLAGWVAAIFLVPSLIKQIRRQSIPFDPVWIFVLAVAATYGLWSFAYTGETFLGGRDQGGYANHALHIARTGGLMIEFPFEGFSEKRFFPIFFLQNLSNLGFIRGVGMEAQFPPFYAILMAQAVGVIGRLGILVFNPIMAALSVPLFFGLARRFLDRSASLVALCVFLLTPIQIWMPRITLSEITAQHFVFAAMLLITGGWLDRRIRTVIIGGLLLGGVSWVRIDGGVAAPMIIIAIAAVSALGSRDPKTRPSDTTLSVWLALAALAAMAAASFSHHLTSSHYFLANSAKLGQIGLLTLILAPVFFLCRIPRIREWTSRFLGQRLAILVLIVLLLGLLAWAAWIRPVSEPLQLHPLHPDRGRTFRENSLVNIVAYLSQPGAFLALVGLIAALWILLRSRMETAWYLPFAVWGGYFALFIYDPHISPDHLWAMRRFVPVIMPGLALLAGLGFAILARGLSRSFGNGFMAFIVCAILAAAMLRGSSPFWFFKENKGTEAFLKELDSRIPTGRFVFSDTSTKFFDPLYPGLGHRIVRVDLSDANMPALIDAIIREKVPEGESVYYLTQTRRDYLIQAENIDRFHLEYDTISPTTTPPPTEIRRQFYDLNLYESKRAPYDISGGFGSITVGYNTVPGIEESGFYGQEFNEHGPFRWTTGEWNLEIPLRDDYQTRSVSLNIRGLSPHGSKLLIRANGIEIHRVFYELAPGRIEIDLPADFDDPVLNLQVENETFVPREAEGMGLDPRALGLMLYGVTLSDQPASKGTFEFGIGPKPGVAEGGFHEPESNKLGLFRWTDGDAWVELPLPEGYVVRRVELAILDLPPGGTEFELLLNGDSIFQELFSVAPGEILIEVKDFAPAIKGDILRLDLRSGSFNPMDQGMGSDNRVLGLRFHALTVTDRVAPRP